MYSGPAKNILLTQKMLTTVRSICADFELQLTWNNLIKRTININVNRWIKVGWKRSMSNTCLSHFGIEQKTLKFGSRYNEC